MLINSFLLDLGYSVKLNHELTGISDDSRDCLDGFIFFAFKASYIDMAIKNGAKTICVENDIKLDVNVIVVKNLHKLFSDMMFKYYNYLFNNIKLIGVIGTNGKTSVSTLIYEYLTYNKISSFLIGTGRAISKNDIFYHENTTPKISLLYKYLKYCYDNNITNVIMEVSSISVNENRCSQFPFYLLIYTNFSIDHLDYHKTIDKYFECKRIPFLKLNKDNYSIVNSDDNRYLDIINYNDSKIITYGIDNKANIKADSLNITACRTSFYVDNKYYYTNLLGKMNVYNILPLFAIQKLYDIDSLDSFLAYYRGVPGRMDVVSISPLVIIDYAHTPTAVEEAIKTALSIVIGNMYVVVGCGGNRDKTKRPMLGYILNKYKVFNIITSDNPRNEKEEDIINDIIEVMDDYMVIVDRKKAIKYALENAKADDCVLILGKGTENYIIKNNERIEYSDYRTVEEFLCLN